VIHAVSTRTRVVVARLEPGEWLPEAVLELSRWEKVDAAFVRGHGILSLAELDVWDAERRSYGAPVRLDGALELAALSGFVALSGGAPDASLHAVVAWRGDDGVHRLAGGLLVRARAVAVELAVDVYDDAILDRHEDAATGLSLWRPLRRA
jgi:predicted DNA-binding protein with PD1-like motif